MSGRVDPMAPVSRPATVPPAGTPADDLIPGDVLRLGDRYVLCHPRDGRLVAVAADQMRAAPGPTADAPLFTALPRLWGRWRLTAGRWLG